MELDQRGIWQKGIIQDGMVINGILTHALLSESTGIIIIPRYCFHTVYQQTICSGITNGLMINYFKPYCLWEHCIETLSWNYDNSGGLRFPVDLRNYGIFLR